MSMDITRLTHFIETFWEDSILPSITDYIRIPNKSPAFDPQWAEHGYMEDAVKLMESWARLQLDGFAGATLEVVRLPSRTPLIFIEVPGDSDDTVLLYGHLDKQPEMKGWGEGMGPWVPVRKGDKLYGRGGADDGYAIYACLCALQAKSRAATTCPTTSIISCRASASPPSSSASTRAAAIGSGCGSPPPCAASRRARSRCAC
jgi:acetylornithine deacetylase/succinyl-diaminopimelate desuccinylase-like protein